MCEPRNRGAKKELRKNRRGQGAAPFGLRRLHPGAGGVRDLLPVDSSAAVETSTGRSGSSSSNWRQSHRIEASSSSSSGNRRWSGLCATSAPWKRPSSTERNWPRTRSEAAAAADAEVADGSGRNTSTKEPPADLEGDEAYWICSPRLRLLLLITHFKDLVEAYRTTAYDNLEAVRYEDENACKEHELIFGDKDNSILPSPTLPTQFCDEPSHQDEVLESVPPRASPRSHQRWVKIVTKIIITASTLHIWKEPKEKRELSISVKELQPGSYPAGNIAVNDGASGSTGISLHPMVTNNQTTALTSFSDAHTRAPIPNFSAAQRPLEGHHNLIFPTVASAPISRNAISDVGIQSAGSCSISPAQCTRAPKRPTKAGKGIKGIKNFAAIGMNVPGSTPHSTAPAAGTVRSDHEIGGSSWNQGYTGVLQMNTATRNDNIAVSKSSNWNRHDATPHSADGSGNWNLNNFASQLNAAPYNTAGYSSIHNDRQEGGISCNLSSANIATQLNAYPLNAAFGYSNIRNNNKIGASSSNNSSTYMATQHAAVPQNTAMHSTHEQDGTQTNWSSTTNAMELNAIPHTTVGGYPEMHNGHQNDAGNSYMNLINIETALVTETSCWDGEIGDSDSVWDWDPADILLRNDFNMNSEQQMANPVDPYQTAYADQDNTGTARRSS